MGYVIKAWQEEDMELRVRMGIEIAKTLAMVHFYSVYSKYFQIDQENAISLFLRIFLCVRQ